MLVRIFCALAFIFSFIAVYLIPSLLPWLLLIFVGIFAAELALGVIFLFVCSLFCYGSKPIERDNAFCRFLGYHTMDSILTLCHCSLKGEGMDLLPEGPVVIVCNHLSRLDPMATFVLLKGRRLAFISKKENMRIPIVGPISQKIGFLPLDRDNPLRAMRTIHFASKMVKDMGFSMGIYPEGTRSRSGELLEFKTGAFVMAKKAGVPVVVSSIRGTGRTSRRYPLPSSVTVKFLTVLTADEVKALTPEELAEKTRSIILEDQEKKH